jgi:hypothetical protein
VKFKAITLVALLTILVFAASAAAMKGQMKGQAALTGKLSNQTVKVSGSLFFGEDEDNAVVCLTLTQNGHKATGCSKNIRYAPGEVTFPATLTGSDLVPGAAALRATVTYSYEGAERSWTWNNPGFMLVD